MALSAVNVLAVEIVGRAVIANLCPVVDDRRASPELPTPALVVVAYLHRCAARILGLELQGVHAAPLAVNAVPVEVVDAMIILVAARGIVPV